MRADDCLLNEEEGKQFTDKDVRMEGTGAQKGKRERDSGGDEEEPTEKGRKKGQTRFRFRR